MPPVDYLVIGHVAKDIPPDAPADGGGKSGHAIGGTVTYSAITAQRMGLNAAIVTAMDAEFDAEVRAALPGIAIHTRPSPHTTTFQNTYTDAGRTQHLRAHAERLTRDDVPADWRSARIVHLGPIAQEFGPDMASGFETSLLALTPQGWLRQWDEEGAARQAGGLPPAGTGPSDLRTSARQAGGLPPAGTSPSDLRTSARQAGGLPPAGRVRPTKWAEALDVLQSIDVLIFSPEDVGHDWEIIHAYTRAARLAVLTLERHGTLVFERNDGRWLAPREARVLDPTGAGDVFAAAFLTSFLESGNPLLSARFANVAASFSIEKGGIGSIPTRAQVDEWMDSRPRFRE